MPEINQEDDGPVPNHQALYSRETLAELRYLREQNVQLSTRLKNHSDQHRADGEIKPWVLLGYSAVVGAGWPIAFGQYLGRFGFDGGAVPYAIFTLLYLTMIGVLGLNTIFRRH